MQTSVSGKKYNSTSLLKVANLRLLLRPADHLLYLSIFLPDASKTDVPEDFDIDLEDPETEKAAVTIQSQFRKFQKKKRDEKS